MIFTETKLKGAYIIDIEKISDERGFFARSFCFKDFETHGLCSKFVQCNISFNVQKGTVRGMHYQVAPHEEPKLVRCTMGAIYDVIIDLRPNSPTFKQWTAVKLNAENRRMFYIPGGIAHGFQTLDDNSEVFYQMGEFYYPEAARGVRWNDPAFDIEWQLEVSNISPRDRNYPQFKVT